MTRMSGIALSCIATLFVSSFVACGSSESGDAQSSGDSSTAQTSSDTTASANPADDVCGVWLGVGYLDDDLLAQKLATIQDEQQRAQVKAMAESFMSTRLGVSFNEDDSYQVEMQIVATNGEVLGGDSEGKWKVVSTGDESVTIEQVDAGTQEAKQTEYTFVDEDHFAMVPPVAEILLDCNPLIVFERQDGVNLSGDAAETTAQSPAGVQR